MLLDTCVLIDLIRGHKVAIDFIEALAVQPAVCPVSILELHAGVRSQREERVVDALVSSFVSVGINENSFRRAGSWLRHYHASHALDVPDALIAAASEQHELPLATINIKHFPMFPRLKAPY
jgi:predicted nucleic acid-binding protein